MFIKGTRDALSSVKRNWEVYNLFFLFNIVLFEEFGLNKWGTLRYGW